MRLSNFVNGTASSNVTIEWTPPQDAVMGAVYTIAVTPEVANGPMDTASTLTSITVLYNTNYMVTVSINAPCAQAASATFILS